MDWQSLKALYPAPKGQPARCARLLALTRVLDGTQYEVLPHDFSEEYSGAGEYIPLSKRRPSVRSNLCRTVVDDSVSLLFADTHWPSIVADDEAVADVLTTFVRESLIEPLFVLAATRGAVGSVALLVEANNHRLVVSVMETAYLTPEWDDAGTLISVRERYQVKGSQLHDLGYPIGDDMLAADFWWQRTWTADDCEVLTPVPVSADKPGVRDAGKSMRHGLGFVPVIWMRNLGAVSGDPDGECTFERAIDTVIEADYLLSQGGRALKYASDPKLVLKTGQTPDGVAAQGGAASALTLPPEGDAKLLEINGDSAEAVLNHWQELRAIVLEQVHGNRSHADKLSAGQSGRAMEMMCLPLVWLADRMRQSYGEGGLLPLLRMVCQFSHAMNGIQIGGASLSNLASDGLALRWPAWFQPTPPELLALAQGLVTAIDGGVLSNETGCAIYAGRLGVPDAAAEWEKVRRQIAERPEKSPEDVRKDANAGKTLSHQVEA